MKITKTNLEKAWADQKLVHGALKAAHVKRMSPDYEDFFQDGLLIYAEMLGQGEDCQKLAFRKIIWRTTDQMRRQQREQTEALGDSVNLYTLPFSNYPSLLAIKETVAALPGMQQKVFYEHLLGNKRLTEMAAEYELSYQMLRRQKRKLLTVLKKELSKEA